MRLKEARIYKKITQGKLACRVGVTQAYISMVENNKRIPAIHMQRKIEDALTMEGLIDWGEDVQD